MKNLIAFLFLISFSFSALSGQNSISGTVFDESHDGVFFATVAIYNQKDSSLIKAESTDDKGFFKLKGIKDGVYYIQSSMIGFETASQDNIVFPKDNKATFNLTMTESAIDLATAEVVGKKPLLEQEADRLIVNVADNVTSLNGNLMNVMKKVPGMIVVNDKLSMAGQQNMTILINGKTTQYMDVQSLMRDMPGDNIQKVEVIHQPGAEFEAAGTGPVINIVLKKSNLFGTNGSVTLGAGRGELNRYKTSVRLSHYEGNVNISGGVGFRSNPGLERIEIDRNVTNQEIAPGIFDDILYDQESYDPDESETWRANLNVNWDVSEKQSLGFQSRLIDSRSDYLIENQTEIISLTNSFSTLKQLTRNIDDSSWKLYVVNPYYSLQLDTAGQKLDLDFSYINIQNEGVSTLSTDEVNFGDYIGSQRFEQPGSTNLYVGKLDYTYPFSKMLKLQTGLKYSIADLDNNLIASETLRDVEGNLVRGEWQPIAGGSNHFLFDEAIAAAYAKLNWKTGKWSGTAGLRYEHSESNGMSVGIDTTLSRTISRPFPSLSLKRELTGSLAATAAYSYRLDRPRYSTLNPFVYYLDPFTSQRGNPNITATFTHSIRANLTFDNQPFFNIEYKLSEDPILEVVEQDANGEAFKTEVNFEQSNNFSTSLFFPLDFIPHISGYGGGIVNRTEYNSPYLDDVFAQSQWSFTGFMQVNSKLPGDVNVELSGWYYSGGLDGGIIIGEHLYGVDFGASRKFLDDKLKVSVGVDNLLVRYFRGSVDFSNIDVNIVSKWEAPVFNIQATYKFGNQHMKSKRHQSGASDLMNRTGKG